MLYRALWSSGEPPRKRAVGLHFPGSPRTTIRTLGPHFDAECAANGSAPAVKHRLTNGKRCFTVQSLVGSFKHRGLKRLYERGDPSGIRPDLLEAVEDILGRLDRATTPQALNLPGYRLHPLKGDLRGFWSVAVRANWRIIFRFDGEDAIDIELVDYH